MATRTTKKPIAKRATVKKRAETIVEKVTKRVTKKKVATKVPEPVVATMPPVAPIPTPPLAPWKAEAPAALTNTTIALPHVARFNPYLGCDPEFFFKLGDTVIGAEKVFAKDGLDNKIASANDLCVLSGTKSKFIIDGVQAELNPRPNTCRANLANEISACFKTLKAELEKQGKGVSVDLSRSITISEEELASLDKDNQKLGCMPSKSVYANAGVKLTDIDGSKHRQRSAGGHIHIGTASQAHLRAKIDKDPDTLVQMLDLLCGNTCVLVDRDEGNKERRKLYGRAGEYRLPKHGLEYRTLSNFWLESYQLMSLAFGMARLSVELTADYNNGDKFVKAFLGSVDQKDVQTAINENDFDLAMSNFKKIESLIAKVTSNSEHFAISGSTLPAFHFFVNIVKEKGLKHYFKQDPITHWATLPECHRDGFDYFLRTVVSPDMKKAV